MMESIFDIAREAGGSKTADEVEETRKLGISTMQNWAEGARGRLTLSFESRASVVENVPSMGTYRLTEFSHSDNYLSDTIKPARLSE